MVGDILALLDGGKCIQKRLCNITSLSNSDAIAWTFRDRIATVESSKCTQIPLKNTNGGMLKLEDLVPQAACDDESILLFARDILTDKHPLNKLMFISF